MSLAPCLAQHRCSELTRHFNQVSPPCSLFRPNWFPPRALAYAVPPAAPCWYLVAKSFPTLCSSTGCSPPGSSVHGISQARILEWVAICSTRGIFPTQGSNASILHWQAGSLPLNQQGSHCNPSI